MLRLSFGLSSLTLSILFAAYALHLVPDQESAIIEGRKNLCEAVAISCSVALQKEDDTAIAAAVQAICRRNPDIQSARVRRATGDTVVEVGPAGDWGNPEGDRSTPDLMNVPIAQNDRPWGQVQFRFHPRTSGSLQNAVGRPILPLVAFVTVAGFLCTFLYLRSALRRADPSRGKVIPERVRETLNTVAEGVLVLDREERIALANDAFAHLVGQSVSDLQGRNVAELPWLPTRRVDSPEEYPWKGVMRDAARRLGTILRLQTDRTGVHKVSVNATSILADDGACRGVLATFDDLTSVEKKNLQLRHLLRRLNRSRKKIHKQQRALELARDAAESASQAKSDFLANVSHEIRTPMNAVIGMAEMVLASSLTHRQRENLTIVKTSAESLLTLINDLLDFSKIEAGKLDLDPIDFPLRGTVADTLRTLAVRAHSKGLELFWHVGPDVPEHVVGDPARLRQILLNLVGNALKFTARGEVIVSVGLGEVRSQESEDGSNALLAPGSCLLEFSVRDTGVGIPPDKLQTIFERFTQADASTTRHYGGTGLGLAICSRLLEMMGGRIWVESEVGRGSVFHFTAQFAALPRPNRPASLADVGALDGLSVLVANDSPSVRRILVDLLVRKQMLPRLPEDGRGVLEELEAAAASGHPYSLVVLDAGHPGSEAIKVAARIKEKPDLARAALLLTTCNNYRDEAHQAALVTFSCLSKPFGEGDLEVAIHRALGLNTDDSRLERQGQMGEPELSAPSSNLRILLVDDNVFNQKVAVFKLEQLGHTVQVASGGREALDFLERHAFDVVFLDIQMPDMDGFAVTKIIRQRESGTAAHLPVVAMTARAMKGDREQCLAAGMDGYVSKPIRDDELLLALRSAIPHHAASPSTRKNVTDSAPGPGNDRETILNRVGGNVMLLKQLTEVFRQDGPRLVTEIESALHDGDPVRLNGAAHSLKGMVTFFGVSPAAEAARELERMGRETDLARAATPFATLKLHVEQILASLPELRGESTT